MATYIDEDLVVVRAEPNAKSRRKTVLAFGDRIDLLGEQDGWTEVRLVERWEGEDVGFIRGSPRVRDEGILRFSMIDVQQGDGMIIETPAGRIVFVDGGDNQLFARHAAARFRYRQSSAAEPLEVDAIVVTHGDADHYDGLNDIVRSETDSSIAERKRLFIHPRRVCHSGLVTRPTKDAQRKRIKDEDKFGRSVEVGDELVAIDLYDDPRDADEDMANEPFKRWRKSLDHWETRGPIDVRRVAFGMDAGEIFDFLHDEGIEVELQGPFATDVEDPESGTMVPALPYFHEASESPEPHLGAAAGGGDPSASHTINGHSIAFRLTFGNVRFGFTGDLNQESMDRMLDHLTPAQLEVEIVKAPHHGSSDFDFRALEAMRPVVAIVSSGDENAMKEYVHPRATLMAALGKCMRDRTGIVLVTELAAFFTVRRDCHSREDLAAFFRERKDETFTGEELRKLFAGKPKAEGPAGSFFGFERTNFGIIHIRTDGERVLVFTHSGREDLNEAYRFRVTMVADERQVAFENVESR